MDRTATATGALDDVINRLARFEPSPLPVISLYLNLQPDQHGKDNYRLFLRKELPRRIRAYPPGSPARDSLDLDAQRIEQFLAGHVPASANGLALFACAGLDGFFEAVALAAPIPAHRLTIAPEPHVYPLERVLDEHPQIAVVHADSQVARIFVFALGELMRQARVEAREKVKRFDAGGWSQMRFQRHVEHVQAEHARELVAALARIVREEGIERILLAGDEVNVPLVRHELSPELAARVIDVVRLEAHVQDHEVLRTASEVLRRHDAKTDADVVDQLMNEYLAGGLAAAGLDEVREALDRGQVSELYLTAVDAGSDETLNDELVAKARQTSARVRFIEDATLLDGVDGIAAALRWPRGGSFQEAAS